MIRKIFIIILITLWTASAYAQKPALKLYVFDCGTIRLPSTEPFDVRDNETDVRDLIVPCYIIEHEDGLLLWDGGLPTVIAENEGFNDLNGTLARLDRTFEEQISQLNLDMSSFDFVAFSHFHYDHIGIANEISGAELLIQRTEYEAAFGENISPYFDPNFYEGLKDSEMTILDGDFDVFGDGSVQIISASGHTPGHQVLFLDLPNYGPLVLSGDLYHFPISRSDRRIPVFNSDPESTLASMDKIENFLSENGAVLWIEHDMALFETLEKAPAFYD